MRRLELEVEVRRALVGVGDPARAAAQQAYMKSAMPYHGVTVPQVRRLLGPVWAGLRFSDRDAWEAAIRGLWVGATHREERYAALALARHRVSAPYRTPTSLPLYRHLIVTGAWWDLVDEVAQHLVGPLLRTDHAATEPTLRSWLVEDDLWLRRTVVICQVGHRSDTDLALLRDAVEATVDDGSFWLRKAVGWALRDYSTTDPAWVHAEVHRLDERLSPLSLREATRKMRRLGGPGG